MAVGLPVVPPEAPSQCWYIRPMTLRVWPGRLPVPVALLVLLPVPLAVY